METNKNSFAEPDSENNEAADVGMSRRTFLETSAGQLIAMSMLGQEQEAQTVEEQSQAVKESTKVELQKLKEFPPDADLDRKFESLMVWKQGFEKRFEALDSFLRETNPAIFEALDMFNKTYNCSLRCVGVRHRFDRPHEIIFINTYERENIVPIRIAIPFHELQEAQSTKLASLLKTDFESQQKQQSTREKGNRPLKEQYELWQNEESFDLPQGKTTVFGVDYAGGQAPIADVLLSVYDEPYNAQIERPIVRIGGLWESDLENASLANDRIPIPIEREALRPPMSQLTNTLTNAVEKRQETFVFHYIIHGGEVEGGELSPAGAIPAEEIAKAIAVPLEGKPLCSIIDILIVADSCYSGMQLDGILKYLKKEKIPVKNLRIVTAGNKTPVAFTGNAMSTASETIKNPHNEKMYYPVMSYHLSHYFQMVKYLKAKGVSLPKHVGTMGHALRHADRMAREDAYTANLGGAVYEQDLQSYHYSTEEEIDKYLSKNDENTGPIG